MYKRQLLAEGTIIPSALPRKRDRGTCLIPCVSLGGYFQPGLNSTMNLSVEDSDAKSRAAQDPLPSQKTMYHAVTTRLAPRATVPTLFPGFAQMNSSLILTDLLRRLTLNGNEKDQWDSHRGGTKHTR